MAFMSAHQQQDDYLKSLASLAAVANEDDMTDMLYIDFAKHDRAFIINEAVDVDYHHLLAESLTPLSTPSTTGAQTPLFDHAAADEAVLSDLPFDSDSEFEIPPSPPTGQRRHRGATSLGEDDFEFPVFLGRQSIDADAVIYDDGEESYRRPAPAGPMRPMLPRAASRTASVTTTTAVPAAPAVPELSGPMMAWWPAPVESLQYDWVEAAPSKARVPAEAHVADLEGPLMSWWPAPAELMEYEWKEKFYE